MGFKAVRVPPAAEGPLLLNVRELLASDDVLVVGDPPEPDAALLHFKDPLGSIGHRVGVDVADGVPWRAQPLEGPLSQVPVV